MRNYTNLSALDVKCKKDCHQILWKASSTICLVSRKLCIALAIPVHSHTHSDCTLIMAIVAEMSEMKKEKVKVKPKCCGTRHWCKEDERGLFYRRRAQLSTAQLNVARFWKLISVISSKKGQLKKEAQQLWYEPFWSFHVCHFFRSTTNHWHFLLEKFKTNHLSAKLCFSLPMCATF